MDISARAHLGAELTHRAYDMDRFEFRDAGDSFTFEGVASVVERAYAVNDSFGTFHETISAGAFDKAIKDVGKRQAANDVFLFVNHRHQDVPMASRNAGTLKLSVNPDLRTEANLDARRPDVVIARSAIQRGEMTQMSIGFTVNKGRDTWNKDWTERTIHEVNLKEVSIVPIGANPYTSASVRSFSDLRSTIDAMDMSKSDLRRAIKLLEKRFSDVWNDEVESWLELALKARFGVSDPLAYIDVEDFKDDSVVFCIYGSSMDGLWQLGYTLNPDHTVTLDTADPTPVNEVTTYVAIRNAFAERDAADRQRHLMRARSPFVAI